MLSIRIAIMFTVVFYADCQNMCNIEKIAAESGKCMNTNLKQVGAELKLGNLMNAPIQQYHYVCGNLPQLVQCLQNVYVSMCGMTNQSAQSSIQDETRNLNWACNQAFGGLMMAIPCLSQMQIRQQLRSCGIDAIGNCSALNSMVLCRIQVAHQCSYDAEAFTRDFWDINLGPKRKYLNCPPPPYGTSTVSPKDMVCSAPAFSTSLSSHIFMVTSGYLLQRQFDWSKIWS